MAVHIEPYRHDTHGDETLRANTRRRSFSLAMRADDQTLTDDHAEEIVKSVLDALKAAYNAVMR